MIYWRRDALMTSLLTLSLLYCMKQINPMLPCYCSVIYHRRRHNVVKTSGKHSPNDSCATFLFLSRFDWRRLWSIRQLEQPLRRRWQIRLKVSYLTMKNSSFARFARAIFIFVIFVIFILEFVLSTWWNDLFCSYVDDVSTWHIFNFFLLSNRWYQFHSRILRIHSAGIMTWNNW